MNNISSDIQENTAHREEVFNITQQEAANDSALSSLDRVKFIVHKSTHQGRLGSIITSHGTINTPAFAFCATKGSVKAILPKDGSETEMIVCNTVHMEIHGRDIVKHVGGLHKFMNWNKPIMTDSGGFQIFSFGYGSVAEEIKRKQNRPSINVKITEEGARFKSYRDGRIITLTPESSISCQVALGSDLMVALDECTPSHADKQYTSSSMERTHRWLVRSIKEFEKSDKVAGIYGVIQGGIYQDLRKSSVEFINERETFGVCIGGSLGKEKNEMHEIVSYTSSLIRKDRPVHLLGIGQVEDIFHGVACGIDTFDCVHPTRIARHGYALVQRSCYGKDSINLNNSCYRLDDNPVDSSCSCYTCNNFTRAYIHHMLKSCETIAIQLLSLHNLSFMNRLMNDIRYAISQDNLEATRKLWMGH